MSKQLKALLVMFIVLVFCATLFGCGAEVKKTPVPTPVQTKEKIATPQATTVVVVTASPSPTVKSTIKPKPVSGLVSEPVVKPKATAAPKKIVEVPQKIITTTTPIDLNDYSKVLIEDHSLTFPNPVAASIANAKLALEYVNGYVLMKGATFSFNDVVGERTSKRGFVVGPLIRGEGLGGGVCKSSTALYQAARDAKLMIIERHNHSEAVPYAKQGDDAAIAYGIYDNRFKNNTNYDLIINCSLTGNVANVKIYKLILQGKG